jgi:hypothetical protein
MEFPMFKKVLFKEIVVKPNDKYLSNKLFKQIVSKNSFINQSNSYFTNSKKKDNKSSYKNCLKLMPIQKNDEITKNYLPLLLYLGLTAIFLYILYKDNVKSEVIDNSILRNSDYHKILHLLKVICAHELDAKGYLAPGRSLAYIVKIDDQIYYHKQCFSRKDLLDELIVGDLANKLFSDQYPDVRLIETPNNDLKNQSSYSFASKGIGGENMNLEQWAYLFYAGKTKIIPKNLGKVLAYDVLMGKKDIKLANIIITASGECYSVDHEGSFSFGSTIIKNSKSALESIGEFTHLTARERKYGNEHQPLKRNYVIKEFITPILLKSIENDFKNGEIENLYSDFEKLTEKDITNVFDDFANFVREDERKDYIEKMQKQQKIIKQYKEEKNEMTQNEGNKPRFKK